MEEKTPESKPKPKLAENIFLLRKNETRYKKAVFRIRISLNADPYGSRVLS